MNQRARILLVGYRKFSELVMAVMPEYEVQADIQLVESVASGSVDYHALIREHRPDVVASAGANAVYLQKTLKLPVITQPVTETDLVDAVARANRIGRRLAVFTYAGQSENLERLFKSLRIMINGSLLCEQYSTTDEAAEKLLALSANNEVDVVVGPSYICHLAERKGIDTVLLYSKQSVRCMLEEALSKARSTSREGHSDPRPFITQSPQMSRIAELARIYARGRAPVLLQGESGTGKEHIAREIHQSSDYCQGALVSVNCGSIPAELFESELFGYVDGAFTSSRRGGRVGLVEQANGGILFLDEVGEMPLAHQVKLLRVLQERRVRPVGSNREIDLDFKLIAATNADLSGAVECGEFRDDLYYRLNVFNLSVPTLRDRPEDISAIAQHYLAAYGVEYGTSVDCAALYSLLESDFHQYRWPGNVRELQNFCERLVVNLVGGAGIEKQTVVEVLPELYADENPQYQGLSVLKQQEHRAIEEAMLRHGGDKSVVSRQLGISATTLWRRLREMRWKESLVSQRTRYTTVSRSIQSRG